MFDVNINPDALELLSFNQKNTLCGKQLFYFSLILHDMKGKTKNMCFCGSYC